MAAIHDGRRVAFSWQTSAEPDWSLSVKRNAKRVDDSTDQPVIDRDVHDATSQHNFIGCMEVPAFTEKHDANFMAIEITRVAEQITGKLHRFLRAHPGKASNLGDTGRRQK
jgi:hypothetical protein